MSEIKDSFLTFKYIRHDLPSGLVVFLVALPLCLGIALASGAPLFSGLITGITGGIVVAVLSGSNTSVSGPAAGLTVIVATAIGKIGAYEGFLLAVMIAGILQVILGLLKAGSIAHYFPSGVIKGMLAAIGIILILKQIPHAFGYDEDYEGDFTFIQNNHENSFSGILTALNKSRPGAIIISIISLFILIIWDKPFMKKVKVIPAPLIVVILGVVINMMFNFIDPELVLTPDHLVQTPVLSSISEAATILNFPDFSFLNNKEIYISAGTLAIVASLETLLSIEAVDRLDPLKRHTPVNRELMAQGAGNFFAGLLGGLPMTAVIVRGSTNVNYGAKTKASSFLHGCFLLLSILVVPGIINMIPYASLAAILIVIGYKLVQVKLIKEMYRQGRTQFIPFIVTIVAIVLTDLLVGIGIGMAVGFFFILRENMKHAYEYAERKPYEPVKVILAEEVSFLNKASIIRLLENLPIHTHVIIDGTKSKYIDHDVLEVLHDYHQNAASRKVRLELVGIRQVYKSSGH